MNKPNLVVVDTKGVCFYCHRSMRPNMDSMDPIATDLDFEEEQAMMMEEYGIPAEPRKLPFHDFFNGL